MAEPTMHVLDVPLAVLADESMRFITQTYQSALAFLFGGPIYEASA